MMKMNNKKNLKIILDHALDIVLLPIYLELETDI